MVKKRPNVLWLMSDQHNANCTGYRNHPNVKTPNLDRIAERGVDFTNAFANNPICSPSRICFLTGQYMHTHGMYGNDHADYPVRNDETLCSQFRKYGYQTALFGKAHLTRRWVDDGFEVYKYTDLCDAEKGDPTTTHYFNYLEEKGLADYYEEGREKPGQYNMDGRSPAVLPYEHSIERYTGIETLNFLEQRDSSRPFFIKMSFQRPHPPISPSKKHFDMYNLDDIVLPENSFDFLENKFAGKPKFMQEKLKDSQSNPMAVSNRTCLKRALASYYALISVIDMEIGRVIDKLEEMGELENTVIIYVSDHGDFAGEHGLFHKNFGLYDSIQKIPFLLSWPSGPKGVKCDKIIESIDLYPTLCELCKIPIPKGREGQSLVEVPQGKSSGKEQAFCEWHAEDKVSAIRTHDFRLVYYSGRNDGELYDHRNDPGETKNLWNDPSYSEERLQLTIQLLRFTMGHFVKTSSDTDMEWTWKNRYAPSPLLLKHGRYWSQLKKAYEEEVTWPPERNG